MDVGHLWWREGEIIEKETVVGPVGPGGIPRVSGREEVVTKFDPVTFPVVQKIECGSYVRYAVREAEVPSPGVDRGFSPISTTLEELDGVVKVVPVIYVWKVELEGPVGDPEVATDKGPAVLGPVTGEVPARGTVGSYPQG